MNLLQRVPEGQAPPSALARDHQTGSESMFVFALLCLFLISFSKAPTGVRIELIVRFALPRETYV